MREKPTLLCKWFSQSRITPASAGKTNGRNTRTPTYQDHPRECGKNPKSTSRWSLKRRITPASAGKTKKLVKTAYHKWDHPRECGKNLSHVFRLLLKTGSPPRVREKHSEFTEIELYDGITPASAGKTIFFRFIQLVLQDHPRECGKNIYFIRRQQIETGSPPRVREKLHTCPQAVSCAGITPASAGKTQT